MNKQLYKTHITHSQQIHIHNNKKKWTLCKIMLRYWVGKLKIVDFKWAKFHWIKSIISKCVIQNHKFHACNNKIKNNNEKRKNKQIR